MSESALVFDPFDPSYIEDPYPFWEHARDDGGVFFSERFDAWVVSSYEDALQVLRQPGLYKSADSFKPAVPLPSEIQEILDGRWEAYLVVNIDPPEHTPVRRAINRALTRPAVENSVPVMHQVADELIDRFVADGRADIATQFAREYPAQVVARILGLTPEQVPDLLDWGHDFETILAGTASKERLAKAARGLVDYQQFFVDEIEKRRLDPKEDLLTAIQQEFDDDPTLNLSTEKIANIPLAVFTAGHNTTTGAICNGVHVLLQHPDDIGRALSDPAVMDHAVEELLRFEPPFPFVRRHTTEPTELGGVHLDTGATVLISLASANRDKCQFAENPDQFDIERSGANRHLALGYGVHFCPGAPLARKEVPIALQRLFERLPNMRVVDYTRLERFVSRGFEQLIVEWDNDA
ncbi:cytochrome P450 [Nitriliruptor alkaliphilus]|uniref:cytochrome P450 n=1 Tax=Nitriliruptor alkaliphilus TaxID=427918 RepID=UPI0006966396|nr:cytochrome P450 [Nitriliruptor alkaliphilus]